MTLARSTKKYYIRDFTGSFIHIPKTAGKFLYNCIEKDFFRWGLHATARHTMLQYPDIMTKPIVCCIRNPWDRIFSLFNYITQLKIISEDFYTWLYNPIIDSMHYTDIISDNFLSLRPYMCDDNKNMIITDVIRFENIQQDLISLETKYNLNFNKLERTEYSTTKDVYKTVYRKQDIDYVHKICEWEINKFTYEY